MSEADTVYGVRWFGPELLERDRSNTCTCPVTRSGATPTVSSATFSLYRGTTALIAAAAVPGGSLSPPSYEVLAASLASQPYGFGYTVRWTVLVDSVSRTFDRPAVVCRRALFPVVAQDDLLELYPTLTAAGVLPSDQTLQQWIDAAWKAILTRLTLSGTLPDIILEPYALRDLHRHLALHLMFEAWSSTLRGGTENNKWADKAKLHGQKYEAAWSSAAWITDTNRNGAADSTKRRRPGVAQLVTVEMRPRIAGGTGGGGW